MSPTSYLTAPSHFASVTLISVKVNLTLGFINYFTNVLPYPNSIFSHISKVTTRYITNIFTTNPKNSRPMIAFFSLFLFVRCSILLLSNWFLFIITYFKKSYPNWVANDEGVVLSLNHPWAKYITLIRNYNINQKNRNQFWFLFHNRDCNLIKLSIAPC